MVSTCDTEKRSPIADRDIINKKSISKDDKKSLYYKSKLYNELLN